MSSQKKKKKKKNKKKIKKINKKIKPPTELPNLKRKSVQDIK